MSVTAALASPLPACALLAPLRSHVANANVALVLVLIVVAAGATGIRPARLVAASSTAA